VAGKESRKKAQEDPRQLLLKELRGLIKEIDREGLLFLIKQANTLIYNQRVERLNQEAETTKKPASSKSKEKENPAVQSGGVSIERGAFGRSFIVDLVQVRKTFDEAEMLSLVSAAQAGTSAPDGAARVYRWLSRNRDDVLLDAGAAGPRDAVMADLWKVLRSSFSIRNQ
jgi:hypothetical protein